MILMSNKFMIVLSNLFKILYVSLSNIPYNGKKNGVKDGCAMVIDSNFGEVKP